MPPPPLLDAQLFDAHHFQCCVKEPVHTFRQRDINVVDAHSQPFYFRIDDAARSHSSTYEQSHSFTFSISPACLRKGVELEHVILETARSAEDVLPEPVRMDLRSPNQGNAFQHTTFEGERMHAMQQQHRRLDAELRGVFPCTGDVLRARTTAGTRVVDARNQQVRCGGIQ